MSTAISKKLLSIYFNHQIHSGINDLRAYTDKIEKYLEDQKYKLEERKQKEDNKTKDGKDSEDLLHNISVMLGYERHIDIFTKSAIISIYTYLEFFLDDFCKKIHECEEKPISPRDFCGNGIFRSKIYLEKVLLINFADINAEWEELLKLNKIRNFLVHSNGVSADKKTRLEIQKFIKGASGVELEGDHLKISSIYIRHILSVIEKILKEVEKQYSKEVT